MIKFSIEKTNKDKKYRAGVIETPHGKIMTPAFIPVATKGTIKSLTPEMVRDFVTAQAVLSNTYHLYLQPGTEILEKNGGLHKFMNWSGPTFTDSGGFQAFSLGGGRKSKISDGSLDESEEVSGTLAKVDDDGVVFKSIIDGSTHKFTPEFSMDIQKSIGADIIFAFDECARPGADYDAQAKAVERTREWAERCKKHFDSINTDAKQTLFGIVQGGKHEDLRRLSAKQIAGIGFEGFGIGGTFDKTDIATAVGWVTDVLPENKPRHLLGIGEPEDLILGIEQGIDTFDCVAPTRIARNGSAYTTILHDGKKEFKRINLLNSEFKNDLGPVDAVCKCYTCTHYTRAYVAHLFRAKEMLAATLLSIHNLYFLITLVSQARTAILEDKFDSFKNSFHLS